MDEEQAVTNFKLISDTCTGLTGFKTPWEIESQAWCSLSAERLIELAQLSYVPFHTIDGYGPYFIKTDVKEWVEKNLIQYHDDNPYPIRPVLLSENDQPAFNQLPKQLQAMAGDLQAYYGPWYPHAVYFLCDVDEVVYVGQSSNLPSRLDFHLKDKNKDFNHIFYLPVIRSEALKTEDRFIQTLQPAHQPGGLWYQMEAVEMELSQQYLPLSCLHLV